MAGCVAPAMFLHVSLDGFLLILARYHQHLLAYAARISNLIEAFSLRIPFLVTLDMALFPDLPFLLYLHLEDTQAYLQDVGKPVVRGLRTY
jgi:hypothetical protein